MDIVVASAFIGISSRQGPGEGMGKRGTSVCFSPFVDFDKAVVFLTTPSTEDFSVDIHMSLRVDVLGFTFSIIVVTPAVISGRVILFEVTRRVVSMLVSTTWGAVAP